MTEKDKEINELRRDVADLHRMLGKIAYTLQDAHAEISQAVAALLIIEKAIEDAKEVLRYD